MFIILHHLYSCYVYTLYSLFAHSSCTFLLILLFIKCTVYCPAHFIAHFILFFSCVVYIYMYKCTYNCTVHGADLTYISLLVIFCMWQIQILNLLIFSEKEETNSLHLLSESISLRIWLGWFVCLSTVTKRVQVLFKLLFIYCLSSCG